MNQIYELRLKVYLLKDIKLADVQTSITAYIDEVLAKSDKYLQLHEENTFKQYSFDLLWPTEQGGIYYKDHMYQVRIRMLAVELAEYFQTTITHHETDAMKGLVCETKIIKKRPIEKIFTLTPFLLKNDGGYWKGQLSFEEFEEQIKVNLIKKYQQWTGEKIDENFTLYQSIQLTNRKPISVAYKNIHFLCDKVEIYAADNPMAQELLFMSLASGIGTSNSRGFGMVNYKFC